MYKSLAHGGLLLAVFLFYELIALYGDVQVELKAKC